MATLRVDGNDAIAVFQAVRQCREYILKNKKPVLLEMMSYRV
jgi:2-oxoisovalerate dehydrogenase E1 component alpha subunit